MTEVNGRMVFSEEEKAERVKPVEFKYNKGPEVKINLAAAKILEARGDGKITKKDVKPAAKAEAMPDMVFTKWRLRQ